MEHKGKEGMVKGKGRYEGKKKEKKYVFMVQPQLVKVIFPLSIWIEI